MSYRRKVWTRSSGCELTASGRAGCRAWIVAACALGRRCVRRARPVRAEAGGVGIETGGSA